MKKATKPKSSPVRAGAKKPAGATKTPAKKAATKRTPAKKAAAKPAPVKKAATPARRADFGAPTAAFFAKQPATLRPLVEALRKLVEEAAPDATSTLKWGMPFYQIGDATVCAIAGHKAHVNLILSGPPGSFDDPDGLLAGDGKTGRHLKLTKLEDLPRGQVQSWLRKAAQLARG